MDVTEVQARCPGCGQTLRAGAKFCSECGARVATEPERETRKTVTAVFADVVGSTPLQETIDAESAHHVMASFCATMREVLEAHDGRVSKFIGDAVVALFGVPAVREDDALRAVRAADAMRGALAQLNEQLERDWGVRIGMRVGVNTGEVVISPEGLAIGDAMNVAARLEQAAGEGEVYVGEATFRHVRHAVNCEPLAPLVLKGKREPVAAVRLIAATAPEGQRARINAPLVGRDGELRRLLAAFDAAEQARLCRLVTIVGSPGLGKTRLAAELGSALAGRAIVVHGRCEPTGVGITFLPVAEVLRDVAEIGEADEPELVYEKLAALLPGDPDLDLIVERAAGVLGIARVATAEETFWSVRRLLSARARGRPLVVVLDDVHWGQPTFLDLIEHLTEWGREAPILLLALARPELREMRPALTEPGRLATDVIELGPLRGEESRRLVDELLDCAQVPEPLARRVLATTEGNPLFLGETLRMLIDDGVLRREADGWVASVDADAVDVPPTITALLAARIARLGTDERSVVERAAVIGKQFYRGAVAELAPAPVAAGIDRHLQALHRKEVVEPEGTTWIDEPVFRFHHVLIRDAAYRTLLKDARADLHERFADWLEQKVGELVGEHEEVIAFHLEQAHDYRRQLGPLDERGRTVGRRAVARLHSAGRRALAREDLPAATNLLGRAACALSDDAPGAADVLIDLLEARLSAGDTAAAIAASERLRAIAGGSERASAWVTIATAQLAQLTDSSLLHETLTDLADAAETLAAVGDHAGLAKAQHVRAQGLALLGQVGEVEAALDQALAAARRAGDARRVTAVLSGAPRAALWGPSPVMRASGRCLDVVRILRMTHGNRHVEAIALRCQAVLEAMRGRADAAREILHRCRTTLEELGLGLELLESEHYAGIVELIAGDHVAAEARLRAAHEGFVARGLDVGAATTAALLARAVLEQGRDDEAEALTRFSEEHGGAHLKTTIAWCGVRAQILARRGEHAGAETLASRAVRLAEATDALVDHGDARIDLARVLRAAGREDDAVAEARRAAELYEAKGHAVGAARAASFVGERSAHAPAAITAAAPDSAELEPAGAAAERNPIAQIYARHCSGFNARDWAGVVAGLAEDYTLVDRRAVKIMPTLRGLAEFEAMWRDVLRMVPDVNVSAEFVEGDDESAILIYRAHGHAAEGGGAMEFWTGDLVIARDGSACYCEIFDPDDLETMRARREELRPLARRRRGAELPLEPLEIEHAALRFFEALERAGETGDWGPVEQLLAPEIMIVDHRQASTVGESLFGAAAFIDWQRALVASSLNLSRRFEVLAASDTVIAGIATTRGRLVDGGGWFELRPGVVLELRDGLGRRAEFFEPEDEAALLVRFEQLRDGARLAATGPAGRVIERWVELVNARDFESVRAGMSEDYVVVDHRPVSPLADANREQQLDRIRSMIDIASDARMVTPKLIGEIDGVCLGEMGWAGHQNEGGGAFESLFRGVMTMRDGRAVRFDMFELDDEAAALQAALRQLDGDAGSGPATELVLRVAEALAARDWERAEACFAPELELVDHRHAAPRSFNEGFVAGVRALVAVAGDARPHVEPLAEIDGIGLAIVSWSGHMDEGGDPLALCWRGVMVVHDDIAVRYELFDEDDEAGMLGALARVRATPTAEPPRNRIAQGYARQCDAINARDWPRAVAGLAEDFTVVDRRPVSPWPILRGPAELEAMWRSVHAMVSDLEVSSELVEGDDECAILIHHARGHATEGGGQLENPAGIVLVTRAGLPCYAEMFDPDDLETMRARREELRPLARRRPGADLPLQPLAAERLALRFFDEQVDAMRTGEWERFAALMAADWSIVDHRLASTFGEEVRDRESFLARQQALAASSVDVSWRYEVLAASDIVAAGIVSARGRLRDGGGPFELRFGCVFDWRGGLARGAEVFGPEDEAAMLARFEQLRDGTGVPVAGPAGRVAERFAACVKARDFVGLGDDVMTADFVVVDHRPVSPLGRAERAQSLNAMQSIIAVAGDARVVITKDIGEVDDVWLGEMSWIGHHNEGGGAFEMPFRCVMATRDERAAVIELFELDAEAEALRAVLRLVGGDAGSGPATELVQRLADALAQRDWDRAKDCFAPDLELVDHRRAASLTFDEGFVAGDARVHVEPLAAIDGIAMAIVSATGHMDESGGPFEARWRAVIAVRDGVAVRYELFDEDDEKGMLAAVARIRA